MSGLGRSPHDSVTFALGTLRDPELAWELAHSLDLDSDGTWSELLKQYDRIDPVAALPVHRQLVENELRSTGAEHYRQAARRLSRMVALAAGTSLASEVDDFVAELREANRRRPRLQQEFDRAGLP